MVDTHSYRLSPFGPALQFGGGSKVISASSFCIRLAEVPKAFDIFGLGFGSLRVSSLVVAVEAAAAEDEPPPETPEVFVGPVPEPEAGIETDCEVLPLRPRAAVGAEFAVALLVADILLAVPGGDELGVAVDDDDADEPVLLVVAILPLVADDDDIVG